MQQRESSNNEDLATTLPVCPRRERKVGVMMPGVEIPSGLGRAMLAIWATRLEGGHGPQPAGEDMDLCICAAFEAP